MYINTLINVWFIYPSVSAPALRFKYSAICYW